jgi:nucleotide-binding universal stress UspA family protein
MSAIRSILVPIDFSEGSSTATQYAANMAKQVSAKVELLNVYGLPMVTSPDGSFMVTPEIVTKLSADAQDAVDKIAADLRSQGLSVETRVTEGAPHEEITRRAREGGFDLIVMGTHGRTGLRHFLIGSTAEKVVRTSKVPVLTVPLPPEQ